ncbi:gamma-glutamyltransferase family protein [Thiomicrorhabdus heinhorstiae]|uniref:Gamma-glutamyltransferase n=1 Tax=Thiomicrorhabdus heinhorstiae TaxID=2748010 RepID=A0ABS0BYM4_9GAMM|nr:gamma-glutamyltransferase [Thiomicrorhabdus heinhorstiae]MBF6058509.1 gamma-glutamyltransferase [Thiomicrorhabdus heinhorstiae]
MGIAFSAPHAKAAQAGMNILRQGGNAVDAMIAAAAAVSVLYPHMTSLAGDGFWLIQRPGEEPFALDASGFAGAKADLGFYQGEERIPSRGPKAAVTIGGAVGGWLEARNWMEAGGARSLPLDSLFEEAIGYAENGIEVTESLAEASKMTFGDLSKLDDFVALFSDHGHPLQKGETFCNPALGGLLKLLAEKGLDDFYRGSVGRHIAAHLQTVGSPLEQADLHAYQAVPMQVLEHEISVGKVFNVGAPTQGLASILILAIYDRLRQADWDEAQQVHHLIESIKQAFLIRDRVIADPSRIKGDLQDYLSDEQLQACVAAVQSDKALPWPQAAEPGDTVWMGCVDRDGTMVSYIQSIYWEFGSGVVIPKYGLLWNNRGTSFSLQPGHRNVLQPGMKPFHTLNPAFCEFHDGRRMAYGTMGGEGQPQTQAALFSRYAYQNVDLAEAISDARWLLGRTWGDQQHDLKLEESLFERIGDVLQSLGHSMQCLPDHSERMGHAGAVVLSPSGACSAATDPRSNGGAFAEYF